MRVIYYNVTQLGSWKVCLPREDPVVWPILLLEMTLASHNMHFCWQPTYKSLANFISELLNCNHMLVMLAPIKSLNSIHISYLIIAQCNHLFLSPRYEHSKRINLMIPVNFSMTLYTASKALVVEQLQWHGISSLEFAVRFLMDRREVVVLLHYPSMIKR